MTKKINKVYAKFQKRDSHGRFVKESNSEKINKVERAISYLSTESTIKNQDIIKHLKKRKSRFVKKTEKIEEPEKSYEWEYFIGADYDSPRGSGHDFNCEFKVLSDKPLSDDELTERCKDGIDNIDSTLTTVVNNCSFKIKNYEKRESNVPSNKIQLGKIRS